LQRKGFPYFAKKQVFILVIVKQNKIFITEKETQLIARIHQIKRRKEDCNKRFKA